MNPRVKLALVLVSVLSLGGVVVAARGLDASGESESAQAPLSSRFEGAQFPDGVRAPNFSLRDQDGETLRMGALRGRPAIVTFLYTTCEETCPAQAQLVKGALNELGHEVPAIAIAVDPPRDTPESASAFLAKQRMTGRLRFALGTRDELAPVWKGFAIQPQLDDAEHQARFTLVDRRGFQRVGFPLGQATPERLAHDVRALERE